MLSPWVDVDWWAQNRERVVTADVRWYLDGRSGRAAYDAGHLPGAVPVDLDRWLAGPPSPGAGRHPLPDPAVFAEGMARLGIGDDDVVVAYDDAGGVIAARLVWMLRVTGHDAALLDGGLDAGLAVPGVTPSREPSARPRAVFTARAWPADRLATIDDVAAGGADDGQVVVDARDRDRFTGRTEPVDPRPGHVPGAVNVPCRTNLAPDGRLLPVDQVRRRFTAAGVGPDTPVVAYCGSGVTACHDLLALEHVGLGRGRLFPGSWSQYSQDRSRPVATGD